MYKYLIKTAETSNVDEVNSKLANGWKVLALSAGQKEKGEAYFLYSLGKFDENEMLLDGL